MSLKKADKEIIQCSVILISIAFVLGILINPELTIKIVSIILAIFYFVFVMLHLMLCFPVVVIGFAISDGINYIIPELQEYSTILYYIKFAIVAIPIYLFIYIALPTFITMGCTGIYDFKKANEILCNL